MSIQSEITRISNAKSDIADAIEFKGVDVPEGSTIDDMAALILQIESGAGSAVTITETTDPVHGGTIVEVTAVDLSGDTVTPSRLLSGYTAHNSSGQAIVGIASASGIAPSGTISISDNGTYDVTEYASASVSVSASSSLQSKSVTPTKSQQVVSPDSGYDGLSSVTVSAIPNAYQDVSTVNAVASDVVSGKKIVNSSGTEVTGTLVIQHYYTGSSVPSSSVGSNGDIYLQTS